MEFRQLASLVTVVEAGFNVTDAAERLHLVQSAVSQHLARLEDELGTQLFVRRGKRLVGLSAAGEAVLRYARDALAIRENIAAIGRDHVDEARGRLRIATTHTQARYVLPPVIGRFRESYPAVGLELHQGTPQQVIDMALKDRVDFAICTEELGDHPALTAIPIYRWNRSLIAPKNHPVLKRKPLSLERICEYPLITYTFAVTGTRHLQATFARAGLKPEVVLSAVDADVIKTYVREGLGIGLIATPACAGSQDEDLVVRDLSHLLPWETVWVAYDKDKYLRRFQQQFIELLDRMTMENGVIRAQRARAKKR